MARRKPPQVHGFLIVDKPAGITSQGLVGILRKRFNERQVGHAGTLDPDATGLMLIGVGRATRLLTFLVGMDKTYSGEVVFGAQTSTLDSSGTIIQRFDMAPIEIERIRQVVAENLTGLIMQIPPMVSAIRVDGKRLHQLAREGAEVERKPRPVRVDRFEVFATDDPMTIRIEVDCSSGTYVRSLADDLGRLMGGGAYLQNLRRTRIGQFGIDEATYADNAELFPPLTAVRDLVKVNLAGEAIDMVKHGRVLPKGSEFIGKGPWAVCDSNDVLMAVYEVFRENEVKPSVVVAEQVA